MNTVGDMPEPRYTVAQVGTRWQVFYTTAQGQKVKCGLSHAEKPEAIKVAVLMEDWQRSAERVIAELRRAS